VCVLCAYVWKSECEYFECDFPYKVLASARGHTALRRWSLHSSCNRCSATQSQTKAACLTPPLGHSSCLSSVIVWRKTKQGEDRSPTTLSFNHLPSLLATITATPTRPQAQDCTALHCASLQLNVSNMTETSLFIPIGPQLLFQWPCVFVN